jgi:hypothetical protein
MLNQVYTLHTDLLTDFLELKDTLQFKSLEELADLAFSFERIQELLKDLEQEAKRVSYKAQVTACAKWMADEDKKPKIQGSLCTAEPDVKMTANIPSRNKEPERYEELMGWFGMPPEIEPYFRLHWPTFGEYITQLAHEAKPLPAGIRPGKTQATPILKMRKRRE